MGYTENISSILKWGNSFQRQFDFPLDRTSMHSSYEDAVRYARGEKGLKSGNYEADERELWKLAYIGQTITVWGLNEKGKEGVWVYSLVPAPEGSDYLADLKPVGSATTESAPNYSAAKALSQGLAVGQLIQVDEAEEVEETIEGATVKNTYQAGFYIVNAPGSISALATSSGADDEIGALETRVSALEGNKVAKTDFKTYQGQVTDAFEALGNKVDTDIQNLTTLTGRVDTDIQNLATHVGEFEGYVTDVDGRLNELETFVGDHIGHEGITISDIERLFAQSEE